MALYWDLSKVRDCEQVNGDPANPENMHPVLHYLLFSCMAVGLRGITEKNKDKFFERLTIYQKMCGSALRYRTGNDVVDVYITMEDIERYIGLKVNVSDETDATFAKRVRTWAKSYKVRKEDNPDGLSALEYVAVHHKPKEQV
jgi:hypothetical protein